ncbi:MAG: hypothetical protein NWQ12_02175, partial [Candidatus Nanopelagicales bacterium]|nr:hypothetical protein [Candidatus Nanopelagicales bacterium]
MTAHPLVERLMTLLGPDHVLTDPGVMQGYTLDWTRRWSGVALAVVRPADTAQVAAVVLACSASGVPIVA